MLDQLIRRHTDTLLLYLLHCVTSCMHVTPVNPWQVVPSRIYKKNYTMKFASRPVNIKKFPLHSPELS